MQLGRAKAMKGDTAKSRTAYKDFAPKLEDDSRNLRKIDVGRQTAGTRNVS
jgi:hypothetical protein